MYKLIHILGITAALFCLSCQKDNSNYALKEINNVTISASSENVAIQQHDNLEMDVKVTGSLESAQEYVYQWKAYLASPAVSGMDKPDLSYHILSKELNLNAPVSLASGSYTLELKVTDKQNGLSFFKIFKLTVNSPFYEGWLVTYNQGTQGHVAFIREDGKVYKNAFQEFNNEALDGESVGAYAAIVSGMTYLNIFTNKKMYQLNANTFTTTLTSDVLFRTPITFSKPFFNINNYNTDYYIVDNGGVYANVSPAFGGSGGFYSNRIAGPEESPRYEAFHFFANTLEPIFYDQLNQRFLLNNYNQRALKSLPTLVPKEGEAAPLFQPNNIGKEMVAGDRGPANTFYYLLKDEQGYYCYAMLITSATPQPRLAHKLTDCPSIEKARSITMSTTIRQFYYAADNNVYVYDADANAAQLVYSFPVGEMVQDLQILKKRGYENNTNPKENTQIVIATNKVDAGTVYEFDILLNGKFKNDTYSRKFDGFGKIVNVNYRNTNE